MDRTRRRTAGLLVAAMVLVTAACNGETTKPSELSDDSSTSAAPSTAAPSTSTSPEQQAVIDQYKSYYNTIYTLSSPSDEEVRAAFLPYADDFMVENWVNVFKSFAAQGKRPGGSIEFGPIEVKITGNTAETRECRDGTSELLVSTTDGTTISHGAPGTLVEAGLIQDTAGDWRVWKAVATEGEC